MFNIGDFVFDTANGANVQVMERIELWGYTSYKVFNPANGSVYKATGEQLKMGGNEAQLDENYLRYVMLLSKSKTRHLPVSSLPFQAASYHCRISCMYLIERWKRAVFVIFWRTKSFLAKPSKPV